MGYVRLAMMDLSPIDLCKIAYALQTHLYTYGFNKINVLLSHTQLWTQPHIIIVNTANTTMHSALNKGE